MAANTPVVRMNGEWLIRHRPADNNTPGYQTERVTIETTASGTQEPAVKLTDAFILFNYSGGREIAFPWANIVRAEYRPHPEP
jgi:hypothetical protein